MSGMSVPLLGEKAVVPGLPKSNETLFIPNRMKRVPFEKALDILDKRVHEMARQIITKMILDKQATYRWPSDANGLLVFSQPPQEDCLVQAVTRRVRLLLSHHGMNYEIVYSESDERYFLEVSH